MKKILMVVVILVLVLVIAPWGIGKVAEQRVNNGLDRLAEAAPYLSIAERKWTAGWFSSEQEVTFEVHGPWLRAMNPAAMLEDFKKPEGATPTVEAETPPVEVKPESVPEAAPEAAPTEALPPADAPVTPIAPIRFTVRNHIVHGPVLWSAGFGIARVDSQLVLSDAISKALVEFFGTDEPVRVSTRVGFFGGGRTTFSGDAHSVKVKGEPGELSWDKFKVAIGYSHNLDDIDLVGKWPRFEFKNATSGESVLMRDITLDSKSERIRGDLYDTDFDFAIDEVHIVGADKQVTDIADVRYVVATAMDGDFVDVSAKFGSGPVKSKALMDLGVELKEVHYDFTLRHLHAETLEKMIAAIKAAYNQPVATIADVDAVMIAPMKEYGLLLLKHDPEFVIDRFGIATPDGEGYIKGVIHLKGVTEQDVAVGGMGLIGKIEAEIAIDVAQKMVEKFPNGATAVGAAVDSGYIRREGDRLVSKIEFKHGELKVNGKAQGIPGLGGPPPQAVTPE
jgi:uncharacterized protein YdgA (DUF945 family)